MRKALVPQHRSTFHKQGFITFEDVLDERELAKLREVDPSPARSALTRIIKKRQLAEIVFELMDIEPIRIAEVEFGNSASLREGDCALLIDLKTGALTYSCLPSHYLDTEEGLVVIFTSRYLDVEKHPVIFRRG